MDAGGGAEHPDPGIEGSRGTFAALFSTSRMPMWVYDPETLQFLAVNETAVSRYGYSRDEFLSLRICDIRTEVEQARLAADLASPRPPLQWSGPWTHRLANGSEMRVQILSHEISFAGRPAVLVTVQEAAQLAGDAPDLASGAPMAKATRAINIPAGDEAGEDDLRAAIGGGQLKVYYQAVVDVTDGRIAGAEALVRWQRPRHGLLAAGQFIPLAERTGLITQIWPIVVDNALADTAAWQARIGQPISVAVNLSARQFNDPGTVDHLVVLLQRHRFDPADLVVEITETAAVADPARMHEIVSGFRLLGVRVALDDFGTGYSSLAYLERTPFDIVKIDRTFVNRITTDPRQRQIVSGVVKLAHTLGMTVIAEGVEEPDQLDQLALLGIEQAQGYHLGRPEPADQFSQSLLRKRRPTETRAGELASPLRSPRHHLGWRGPSPPSRPDALVNRPQLPGAV